MLLSALLLLLCTIHTSANQVKRVIPASGDTFIRRDRQYQNYGSSRQLTVTTKDAKSARVAIIKFDNIGRNDDVSKALLRLFISEVDDKHKERVVKIRRINEDFYEDEAVWSDYNMHEEDPHWVEFRIVNDYEGKIGQVDITEMLESRDQSSNSMHLAIFMSDKGFVKFASKEHENQAAHPTLLVLEN